MIAAPGPVSAQWRSSVSLGLASMSLSTFTSLVFAVYTGPAQATTSFIRYISAGGGFETNV